MISVFNPISRMVSLDHENDVMIMINSPMRLMVGGRARFARPAVSHHVAISGSKDCNPRARIIVRLWMRS